MTRSFLVRPAGKLARLTGAGLKRVIDARTLRELYRGDLGPSGAAITRWIEVTLTASMLISNIVGAAAVYVLSSWIVPLPQLHHPLEIRIVNLVAVGVYGAFAVTVGILWGRRRFPGARDWIEQDLEPTPQQREEILRGPYVLVTVPATMWAIAVGVFGGVNAYFSLDLARVVASTVALGGITTTTVTFLLAERFLRPAAARALAGAPAPVSELPGVRARTLLGWAMGTGIPVLGLMLIAITSLSGIPVSAYQLSLSILGLGGMAVSVGLLVTVLVARSTADPIRSLRQAVQQVERGDFDCEVSVYDGTEIGGLQEGFNRMIAGLRERERIRDLFGRQVGEEVARAATEGEIELGGELRDVAVVFADIVGSTSIAASREPHHVVDMINRFLGVVIRNVDSYGGWVNKFEGDAALSVFGAPLPLDDAYGKALAAARRIGSDLREELPECSVAIGVAAGTVVAGHVGSLQRYEYTVIGDAVNEAARLTELAKTVEGGVLASGQVVDGAGSDEATRWRSTGSVVLRGRSEPTCLAVPAPA